MTSQEINPMEGDIFTAENVPQEKKPEEVQKPKTKKHFSLPKPTFFIGKLKTLKALIIKPKFLVILALVIIIPIIYIAFVALNSKPSIQPKVDIITPETQNPDVKIDKDRALIDNKIKSFRDELELPKTDAGDLTFPKVDLDIKF